MRSKRLAGRIGQQSRTMMQIREITYGGIRVVQSL